MKAPIAKRIPHKDELHNSAEPDYYYWLRDRENPEVIDYLNAENDYTEQEMAHKETFHEDLYQEMVARIKQTDLSVPVQHGDYFYYSRTEKGKDYSIHCRKKGSLEAEEEVLLDGNELAKDQEYFSLSAFSVSDDHRLLAYSADFSGNETYTIYVKNLETGELLEQHLENTAGSIAWANDNQCFLYNTLDETHRPYRVYRHHIEQPQAEDELLFEELDGSYFVYPFKMEDKSYLGIYLSAKVTSAVYLLDAEKAAGPVSEFIPRKKGHEYQVTHHGKHFYILSNENALNFQLFRCPDGQHGQDNWELLIPHDESIMLSSLTAFKKHLVVHGRKGGFKSLHIWNLETDERHDVDFPEPVYTINSGSNPEFETSVFRFHYQSLVTPRRVYDYDMETREWRLLKEYEVLGGYDPEQYTSERRYALADDGTQIPLSIVYRKDVPLDGSSPCLLYGYGSYGISSEPYFSTIRLSLLERGFVYVVAHIRGGGEMGRAWYEAGKFLNKKNTFSDFIRAAEFLIEEKYSSSTRLGIRGGSAGGLLIGNVINQRPELFEVALAAVPFVDVMNTMLDASIPLTVAEYDEWGNPNEAKYYAYMKSYSPYDNVKEQAYPHLLITAGLNDPRVQYWEPAKWIAKLRRLNTGQKALLLKTNMEAGHGGASGRYSAIREIAFEYSFLLDKLGIA